MIRFKQDVCLVCKGGFRKTKGFECIDFTEEQKRNRAKNCRWGTKTNFCFRCEPGFAQFGREPCRKWNIPGCMWEGSLNGKVYCLRCDMWDDWYHDGEGGCKRIK